MYILPRTFSFSMFATLILCKYINEWLSKLSVLEDTGFFAPNLLEEEQECGFRS